MTERVLADRYRVLRKLGEGGMAEVFLVHDPIADRPVALKLLKAGESGRDYFMHEFRVLARLDHPYLVEVYDFGTLPAEDSEAGVEQSYYTCEYLSGENLFSATAEMDFDGLFDVICQILQSLAYIHDRGLVHYDIKPENIYVQVEPSTSPGKRPEYRVKLVDFGLTGAATTRRGEKIKGTVHYVAPEVAKSLPADRRADLYSLGITLYYVATRKLPYDGGSAISIIRKHIERIPAPPATVRADVPEAWASFILRLIEKDPAARYAGAPEALEDLSRRLGKPYEPPKTEDGEAATRIALSPSFVGRSDELERLAAALPGPASGGKPHVFWIEGEEGLGKSRLIHALKVRAQLLGVPFLDSVCLKEGERPFARIVRLALMLPEVRPLADAAQRELETLFPGITDGGQPRKVSDPGALRLVLDRVAAFLLEAARKRPFVLVLEDVRRANEITVALLGNLLRGLAKRAPETGLLVVLTDRPEGESGEVLALTEDIPEEIAGEIVEDLTEIRRQLAARGEVVSMPLGRLSLAETAQMVGSMLALADVAAESCTRIHETTGGNPLFIEELVRSLVEDGLLTLRRTTPEDLARVEPPSSLAELLGQRLARMPEDTRAVLVALAVLIAPSDLTLLSETAKRSVENTLDALDLLIRRQMVYRVEQSDGPPHYRLAHSQVQRSVIKSISRRALEATHRRAQAALERAQPDDRSVVLDRLARHAFKGGDLSAALSYAVDAGVFAQQVGNPQQAIDLLDRALELLRWEDLQLDDEHRRTLEILILTRISEVLSTVGRYKDAARALEELLGLGSAAMPGAAPVWARRRLGDLALRRGNSAEARRWLQEALVAAGREPNTELRVERARALEVMSRVALWRGDYLRVIALASETVEILEQVGRERGSLWARTILCTSEYYRGRSLRAADHLRRCLDLARDGDSLSELDRLNLDEDVRQQLDDALRAFSGKEPLRRPAGDSFGLVLSFTHAGTYVDMCSGNEMAIAFYSACVEAYERIGDAQKRALSHNNLGVYKRHAGQFAGSLSNFEASLAIHEGTGDRHGGAVALMNLCMLLLALGDADGAAARAKRALAIARDIGITWVTGHCHRVLGRVYALQGALADAEKELQRAAGVFRMIGNPRSLADLLLDRAEVLCEARDLELARRMLAKATAAQDEKAGDFLARARLLEGRLALSNDASQAVDSLEASLRAASSAGLAELTLEAHRALAATYTRLGTLRLAQEHQGKAHAIEVKLLAGLDPTLRERFELSPSSTESRATSRRLVERSLEDSD